MNLRKCGALFLALVLTLSLCAVPAAAAGSDFEIQNGVLTGYTGPGGAVVIPDGVTEIGDWAFSDCTGLTSVTIPGSVTKIDYEAFEGCTGLTSVTIPASVTEISSGAFGGTPWLKSLGDLAVVNNILLAYQGPGGAVVIPDGVTKIGDDAFYGCTGLISVIIPNSVTEIGWSAFEGCTGLTSVTIPNGVTAIGMNTFSDCTGLISVTIPDGVTEIGDAAFYGCTGLTSVTIPGSVTEIGVSAFDGCTGLTSVIIPDSVTEIGDWAFKGCTGLTNVTIPDSVTKIGGAAFYDTPWPKSLGEFAIVNHILLAYHGAGGAVTIPDGITTIDSSAFADCTGLTSVTIPGSVTKIGDYAFAGCFGLTSVTIPDSVTEIGSGAFNGTPWLKSLGELAIANHILLAYQGAGGAVTIPGGVTEINGWAFSDCTGLTSVTIPAGVTEIGDCAFFGCIGLTSVTIPDSVTEIGSGAFYGCTGLTIHGVPGSEAQTFAEAIGIPFIGDQTAPAAYAAPQTVLVDGKEVKFDAYALKDANGNMTNYFKVRDVASVLGGTAAQFNVGWENQVVLHAKTAYTPNGSEMTTPFSGDQPYKPVSGNTLVGGATQKLAAITLTDAKGSGYTYYKLRDLGEALGFKVDWNGKNVTISTAA